MFSLYQLAGAFLQFSKRRAGVALSKLYNGELISLLLGSVRVSGEPCPIPDEPLRVRDALLNLMGRESFVRLPRSVKIGISNR